MQTPAQAETSAADRPPSKSQRKRDMHALQALGVELVALNPERLARIELPDTLRDALEFIRGVTRHEARRRQMQLIGKLMRQVDGDAVRAALGEVTGDSRAAVARMHRCERWRERLLDDDAALTQLLEQVPAADAQALRATIRAARREREAGAAPKHGRVLYRALQTLLPRDEDTA